MNLKNPKTLFLVIGIFIVFLLVILLVLLLTRDNDPQATGPNQPNTPTTPGGGSTPKGQIELSYWGLWEPETVMDPIIKEYENANPNVKIKYSQQPFYDYEATLHTRLQQGSVGDSPAPDIVKINNSWLPRYENLLSPLPSDIMPKSEYSETFFPACLEDFTGSDGNIYAIPIGIDGLLLYYNKVLLSQEGVSEPPRDWDGIIELANSLTKVDSAGRITQAGLAMGTTNNVSHSADILSFLLLQNNIEVAKQQANGIQVDLTGNKAKSALQFYRSFTAEYNIWSPDLPLDLDMFFKGELAMFFAPSWRVFDIMKAAPHIEFDVVPAPQLEANDPVYYGMYWGEAVSLSSQHKEEAWKFLKFLSQKEKILQFHAGGASFRNFGQPYPRLDLESNLSDVKYAWAVMEMAPHLKSWKMSQNPTIEEYINRGIDENDLETAGRNINQFLADL